MAPLLSAIVPSYNYARFVARAVESCLAQTLPDVEVVVMDDASTDGSARLLEERFGKEPRVRLELARENKGISGNFNRGLRAASGKYVGFCCADDEWLPGHAERLVRALEGGAVLAYARPRVVTGEGEPLPPGPGHAFTGCPDELFFERLVRHSNGVSFVATVFEREAALEAGGFDEGLRVLQDYALWFRLSARRPVRFVDEETVLVRWHGDNASTGGGARSEQLKRDAVRVFESLLARETPLLRERGLERVARGRLADALRRLSTRTASGEEARSCARRAIALEPFSARGYVDYIRALARTGRA